MGFLADRVQSGRDRQKQALISEAQAAGSRVVEVVDLGDPRDGASSVLDSSLVAMFGGRMQVDGLAVVWLETHGWRHAFVQPFSGFTPLPGEHHAVLHGGLPTPAILREELRRTDYPWDPAAGVEVAEHLRQAPALRRAVEGVVWEWPTGMAKVTLDWAVQLRSVGDGTTHVVMQSGRYGGLTTYEVGFRQWLQVCQAVHPCLGDCSGGWIPPAQAFVAPARYAAAVGFAVPGAPAQQHAPAPQAHAATHSPGHSPVHLAIDYAEVVRGALTVHAGKRIWIGGHTIPAKSQAKLRELVLGPQRADSPILAAVDLTLFGSTNDAIVITPTQLLAKEFDDRLEIELAAIRAVPPGQSSVANSVAVDVDRLGTIKIPVGVHVEPVLALVEAIARANASAGQAHAQVSAFVGVGQGQVSPEQAQAMQAQAQAAMYAAPGDPAAQITAKINAAAQLLVGGDYRGAVDAYLAIAQAHPERTGVCYSQVGAALFFLGYYADAIQYYEAAKQHGADPRMMDENIAEARGYL